jgi:hypothetical protein
VLTSAERLAPAGRGRGPVSEEGGEADLLEPKGKAKEKPTAATDRVYPMAPPRTGVCHAMRGEVCLRGAGGLAAMARLRTVREGLQASVGSIDSGARFVVDGQMPSYARSIQPVQSSLLIESALLLQSEPPVPIPSFATVLEPIVSITF